MTRSLPWKSKSGTDVTRVAAATTHTRSATPNSAARTDVQTHNDTKAIQELDISKDDKVLPQEYMMDGLDQDDKFIMVEDEFLAIAKSITAELHHAHYRELQERMQNQGKTARQRYVDPRTIMPGSLQHNKEVARRRKLLQTDRAEEEEDLDEFMTGALGKLMQPSGKHEIKSSLLEVSSPSKSLTRAAAGFNRPAKRQNILSPVKKLSFSSTKISKATPSPESPAESSDSDDFDRPLPKFEKRSAKLDTSTSTTMSSKSPLQKNNTTSSSSPSTSRKPSGGIKSILKPSKRKDTWSDDEMNDFLSPEEEARWKRRREAQLKEETDPHEKATSKAANMFGLSFK